MSLGTRRHPPKATDKFYLSREWRVVRLIVLRRDGYRCVICRRDVSASGEARVDHVKPRATHPELSLVVENLRTLCTTCDSNSHREKRNGSAVRDSRFTGCDIAGRPFDPDHVWNR